MILKVKIEKNKNIIYQLDQNESGIDVPFMFCGH